MTIEPTLELVWRDQATDILELLSIADPGLLDDPERFWNRVASSLSISPKENEVMTARACMEQAGGSWEDQYQDSEGLADDTVYGEFLALLINLSTDDLNELQSGQRQTELPLDYEDEAIGTGISHDTHQHTLGDLVKQVVDGNIKLNPKWQRQFVWPTKKSQRYIESLLLDIPTPSILLYHQGEGDLGIGNFRTVVDGRQRLETLLRFVATRDELTELGFTARRFKTPKSDLDEFKSFQPGGILFPYANLFFDQIDPAMQRTFKDRLLPITEIRAREPKMLYHIFGRYNTGSEKLNPAEIRNAVYQEVPIHNTLWELARESQMTGEEVDEAEAGAITQLKSIMGKKKRYGTYDFIGRVMAFTHLPTALTTATENPSANIATNRFYDEFDDLHGDHELLRKDFVEAFIKVVDWYEDDYLLVKPPTLDSASTRGRFHAWVATIQMATAHFLRNGISENRLDEDKLEIYIRENWPRFAGIDPVSRSTYRDDEVGAEGLPSAGILQMRQNPANFWQYQREWLRQVEEASLVEERD